MALLSAGCKATFESLPNVHSFSTTHNSGRATLLDGNRACIVDKVQSICISGQFKVILLFRTSCFTDSPIWSSQTQFLPDVSHKVPLPYPSTYYHWGSNSGKLIKVLLPLTVLLPSHGCQSSMSEIYQNCEELSININVSGINIRGVSISDINISGVSISGVSISDVSINGIDWGEPEQAPH